MRIDSRGVGLEVDVDGAPDGPPVVFLHGISSCAATYGFLVPGLRSSRSHRGASLDEVRRFLDTYAPA